MLKWLRTNWRTVLLLAAVWLVFECWISWAAFCDQPQHETSSSEAHKEYSCVSRGPILFAAQSFWRWGRHTFDDAESVIALFTGVLAISTIFLWAVTKTAADAAKVAAEHIPVVEGAYVYVLLKRETVEADIKSIGTDNDGVDYGNDPTIYIQIALKNFGKTPAFIERFTARISLIAGNKRVDGSPSRIQPNTIVGAGSETDPPVVVAAPVLSKTDAEMIHRAAAALILEGSLIYRDIWGR